MAQFKMKIAGCTAIIHSLFDSTRDYCRKYLTEDAPEFAIHVFREDLIFEQEALRREALEEGIRVRCFPDPFLERAAIQRKFAEYLLEQNVLLMHGSTVAVDGRAYLFTAACGTGKSTHTRLWREVFGSRAVMVNDDKPFLRIMEQGVLACGAPWSGKHGLDTNVALPLAGICILERGSENRIWPISSAEALPMLRHQSFLPEAGVHAGKVFRLVTVLAERTPLWRMSCTKALEAAELSHRAMSGNGNFR